MGKKKKFIALRRGVFFCTKERSKSSSGDALRRVLRLIASYARLNQMSAVSEQQSITRRALRPRARIIVHLYLRTKT